MRLSSVLLITGGVLLLLAVGWYLEKRVVWARYRRAVLSYAFGFSDCIMQEDVFDLVSYVSDFLDIVEDRFKLPHHTKYPLSRSANYAQFALICIMDYAEMHQLSELYDRSRDAYKRDEPYWDAYSLEVP